MKNVRLGRNNSKNSVSNLYFLSLALFACLFSAPLFAQQPPNIVGNLISLNTFNGVPNHPVLIYSLDSLQQFNLTVTTDSLGNFKATVPTVPAGGPGSNYGIKTYDCQQNSVFKAVTVAAGRITQTSLSICTVTRPVNCPLSFTWFPDSSVGAQNQYRFVNTSQCAPGSIVSTKWSVNYGVMLGNSPSFLFPAGPGQTFTVCLSAVYANGAEDSVCQVITTPRVNPTPCNQPPLHVLRRHDGLKVHFLSGNVNQLDSITTYRWSFGDGSMSQDLDPIHVYSRPGTYQICLTVLRSFALNCPITFCDTIVVSQGSLVNPPIQRNNRIFGTVQKGQSFSLDFAVEVVGLNGNRFYKFKKIANDTLFTFDSLPQGKYLVRAWLTRNDADFANWLPTYFGNKVLWRNAKVVYVGGSKRTDINLVPRRPRQLLGRSINGNIGAINITNGRVAASTDINTVALLMDENGNPYEVAWLDANRDYAFTQLASGTYNLTVESPTMPSVIQKITLSNTINAVANFTVVNDKLTTSVTSLGINNSTSAVRVYPQPATSVLNLTGVAKAKYQLLTTTGALVLTGQFADNEENSLQIGNVPTGMYLLQVVQPNGQQNMFRISKQ